MIQDYICIISGAAVIGSKVTPGMGGPLESHTAVRGRGIRPKTLAKVSFGPDYESIDSWGKPLVVVMHF